MANLKVVTLALALLTATLAATGCQSSYGAPINGDRALSPEEQRLQAVETKLADLTRRFNSSEASRDQKLSGDLGSLRGLVEQQRYDFDSSQKRLQDQSQSYDTRLKALEAAQQQQPGIGGGLPPQQQQPYGTDVVPGAAVPASGGTSQPAAQAVPASAAADEEAAYLKSFDLLKAGKYDDAIRGFNGMLAKYPQGNYSDNAIYWTAESYYIKKDYPNALTSYRSLLEKFPASPKVPDGLLKTGMILQEQGKTDQGRAAYARVLKEFPNSSSATQARNRLAQLR